ncbi:MAG: glycerophosphodiester phosphodiesterase [Labilithrix sp.]|nr:glycerophosphodiester phosphodiesterase [Labilithrix sp.]MCW5814692.1 glycerophosphodiester phosphodiesterase [Labilithrix sp.]
MVKVLGHRGGRGEGWPAENSIAAFARAFAEGADGVELDVRLSRDGVPVLLHDPKLADGRVVGRCLRAELDAATLDDALDVCRGKIVNVEVKPDAPQRFALVRAVARSLARAARDVEVVVSSFDPAIVLAFAALAPRHPRAMLVGARTPRLTTRLPLALRRLVVAAHLHDTLVSAAVAARIRAAGLRLCVWTVNDASRASELAALGAEWLITDGPREIVAATR